MSDEDRKPIDLTQQYLANERTFLAWIRTSIALIGLGFVVARFGLFLREFQVVIQQQQQLQERSASSITGGPMSEYSFSSFLGVVMIGLGVVLIIYSLKSYRDGNNQIQTGVFVPKKNLSYVAGVLLAIFGAVTIAYLLVVSLR